MDEQEDATEDYVSHCMINCNGTEYLKKNIYMYTHIYITESLCCTAEIDIVNQLYVNENY